MHDDQAPSGADQGAIPTQVAIDDASGTITIGWADGHDSRYRFWLLRGLCPCAVCQGHGGSLKFVGAADPSDGGSPSLVDVLEVGHYALNLTWDDGHKTGIYALDYLRNLCGCESCLTTPMGRHITALLPEARRDRA